MIKFIVTGTGRSGTVYMARLLTSLGIMCGHESIFEYDGLENAYERLQGLRQPMISGCSLTNLLTGQQVERWFDAEQIQAESSYLAAPFLDLPILGNTKVVHVVRNPLHVISSFVNDIGFFRDENHGMRKWRSFVYSHAPSVICESNEILKACRYYIEWNKLIQKKADSRAITVRLEDQPSPELFDFLGVRCTGEHFCDKDINSWKRRSRNLTFHDIPNGPTLDEFYGLYSKLGYVNFTPKI